MAVSTETLILLCIVLKMSTKENFMLLCISCAKSVIHNRHISSRNTVLDKREKMVKVFFCLFVY